MTFKEKLNNWYVRPRTGGLMNFAIWLLTHNKALKVTLLMGQIAGLIFCIFIMLITPIIELTVIFGIFSCVAIYTIIKTIIHIRRGTYDNLNLAKLNQIEVINDGTTETETGNEFRDTKSSNANDGEPIGEKYKNSPRGILEGKKKSEPTDISFIDLIQESDKTSREFDDNKFKLEKYYK